MRDSQSSILAAFTASLALAGLGLALAIRRDVLHRRADRDRAGQIADAHRVLQAAAMGERLSRLEKLAAARRAEV